MIETLLILSLTVAAMVAAFKFLCGGSDMKPSRDAIDTPRGKGINYGERDQSRLSGGTWNLD